MDGTAVQVAVKVQVVRDERGRYHMEVGATCPQLTDELKRRRPENVQLYTHALLKISRQLQAAC